MAGINGAESRISVHIIHIFEASYWTANYCASRRCLNALMEKTENKTGANPALVRYRYMPDSVLCQDLLTWYATLCGGKGILAALA